MRVEGLQIDFPNLNENPFSTSPLETGQESLYVGRLDVRGRISKHINFRSNRRLLIVGEMGSGRTSLLRCSASEAPVYVHIDHISATRPAHSLLENLYSQLIDYDIPQSRAELAHKIVDASRTYTSKIPLIVIDMPTVETSVMTVALRDALPMLERLKAVVVVVVEPKQRSILPDSILHSFASIETLESLTVDEVKVLIEKRVSSATSKEFELSTDDAQYIHSLSGGKPSEVIRFMRDSIDASLHSQKPVDTVPNQVITTYLEPVDPQDIQPIAQEEFIDVPDLQSVQEVEINQESEIIDASLPWQERDTVIEMPSSQDAVSEIFGFDLDLEGLSDSKLEDEPIETFTYSATPENEELIIADSPPPPAIDAGTFHALLGRTRGYKKDNDGEEDNMVMDEQSSGAELWVSEELISPVEIELDISEEDSAALIHDEIGLPEINTEDFDNLVQFEEPSIEEIPLLDTSNMANSAEMNYLSPILQALQELLIHHQGPQPGGQRKLAEALASMRREKQGEKHDFPLNPAILSSLSHSESYVVSIAQVRRFSPSDKEILGELKIKRPRLSQISNSLLKSGILNVRTVGRSRFFQLTQDARAQLTAWGLIGGVE
ncbi:MAG: helix-turn-helix domain-containing protein [Candidatus Poseidoniaceae archaeon]|nr:helix-turn-helix domain-containing protein [Candidatus Poseidoniaceae archaeon]